MFVGLRFKNLRIKGQSHTIRTELRVDIYSPVQIHKYLIELNQVEIRQIVLCGWQCQVKE